VTKQIGWATAKVRSVLSVRKTLDPHWIAVVGLPRPDFARMKPRNWWLASFVMFVALPTFSFLLYDMFLRSPGYISETRMAVRAAPDARTNDSDASSMIGKIFSAGASKSTAQDAYIVLNYIKSSAIITDLGGINYFEPAFARPNVDLFNRLKKNSTIEELLAYWQRRMVASVDTVSGILTVDVEGFDPSSAQRISQDIVAQCEKMINAITLHDRGEAMAHAENEVEAAAGKLAAIRADLLKFRIANDLIDPSSRASVLNESLAGLTKQKIEIETSLATLSSALGQDSPTQRIQRDKLATIDRQIADVKNNLAGGSTQPNVSSQIVGFEKLTLEEQFAAKIYLIAQASYQRARQEFERKQLYLAVIVPPTHPEEASFPRPLANLALVFSVLAIAWSIVALVTASIQDQRM
jgi:capsular polysaccharide transport system permease protein